MSTPGDMYLGTLGPDGRLAIAASVPDLARKKIEHTMALRWEAGRFSAPVSVNWTACALLTPAWPQADFLYVGAGAQLLAFDAQGGSAELAVRGLALSADRIVRGACVHEGSVWLVGTQGTVLQIGPDLSLRDHSVPAALVAPDALPSFECVSGSPGGAVYCAGWDGQIWVLDKTGWSQESSPTNLILSALCVDGGGDIHAVGQGGTVVRGHKGAWEAVPQVIRENLWSCVWFEDTLYASSYRQLFMMEDGELCTVELPDDPKTYGKLSERGPVLLSTGASDLLLLLPDRMVKLA